MNLGRKVNFQRKEFRVMESNSVGSRYGIWDQANRDKSRSPANEKVKREKMLRLSCGGACFFSFPGFKCKSLLPSPLIHTVTLIALKRERGLGTCSARHLAAVLSSV